MKRSPLILICDDDPGGRETLESLLTGEGYRLVFAENGKETLKQVFRLLPDLILLDVMMPGMDGFEVCRQVREHPDVSELPIIMVTSLDDSESRIRGLQAGADDFISKPIHRHELRARVKTVVRLNRYRLLVQERTRFHWMAEHSPEGYLMMKSNGDITYANARAREFLGIQENAEENLFFLVEKLYAMSPSEPWTHTGNPEDFFAMPRYLLSAAPDGNRSLWLKAELIELSERKEELFLVHLRDVTEEMISHTVRRNLEHGISRSLRSPLHQLEEIFNLFRMESGNAPEREDLLNRLREKTAMLQKELRDIQGYVEMFRPADSTDSACTLADLADMARETAVKLGIRTPVLLHSFPGREKKILLGIFRGAMKEILKAVMENARNRHPGHDPFIEMQMMMASGRFSFQIKDDGLRLSQGELYCLWTSDEEDRDSFSADTCLQSGLSLAASLIWSAGGSCRAANREDRPGLCITLVLPETAG